MESDERQASFILGEMHLTPDLRDKTLSIIVLGASGDLAKKKTYPALWALYRHGYLPLNCNILGFARSKMSKDELIIKIRSHFKVEAGEQQLFNKFLSTLDYVAGHYDAPEGFVALQKVLVEREKRQPANRVIYLALPPSVFGVTCEQLRKHCWTSSGWNRVVIEKPFGTDLESSNALGQQLAAVLKEDEMYRIDHYLGKEMVQNLIALRHVYAHVYTHVYAHVYTHGSTHVYNHVDGAKPHRPQACVYTYICICLYTRPWKCRWCSMHMFMHMSIHMSIHVSIHM